MKQRQIVSMIAVLLFGLACKQSDKEVILPSKNQAMAKSSSQISNGSNNSAVIIDGACASPTNLVIQNYATIVTWVSPYTTPTNFRFTFLNNNGVILSQMITNTTSCTLSGLTIGSSYEIRIETVCDKGGFSDPLIGTFSYITPPWTGGVVVVNADNLDAFTGASGTVNGKNYTYNPDFYTWNTNYFFSAQNLENANNGASVTYDPLAHNCTNFAQLQYTGISTIPTPSTYKFRTPSTHAIKVPLNLQNSTCMENSTTTYLDITLKASTGLFYIKVGSIVAYRENVTGAAWKAFSVPPAIGTIGNENVYTNAPVLIPNLKRNKEYIIKFLSTYSMQGLSTYDQTCWSQN